jgi:hypothetical protein
MEGVKGKRCGQLGVTMPFFSYCNMANFGTIAWTRIDTTFDANRCNMCGAKVFHLKFVVSNARVVIASTIHVLFFLMSPGDYSPPEYILI